MYEDGLEDFDCPPLENGTPLAPGYEVTGHLHQSNNFDVYEVWSGERACSCIAKCPRQDLLESAKVRRGLLREGRLLEKLAHPHIVRLYEVCEEPYPVLVLETLTGETLSYLIESSTRRLPLPDVVHLGLHLCSAVHYLHRHGILHLDLKPSNIVSERQIAKILDLSIARPPGRGKKGAGTLQYMAPEQVRGEPLTPATDVWGIGAVLFEAATAVKPFNAAFAEESSWYYTDGELPEESPEDYSDTSSEADLEGYEQVLRRAESVRAYRRVPAAFREAVDGCLEPDPAARPTLEGLRRALEALA